MKHEKKFSFSDWILFLSIAFLVSLSIFVLRSIAPFIFPAYFIYIIAALFIFLALIKIEFEVFSAFSTHLYVVSILLLLLPLIFGQVTRGSVRWIPLGPVAIQPSEIVRPFILLFFAKYLTSAELNLKRVAKVLVLFFIPFFLILVQPSLGVAALTALGFLGVVLASSIEKKYLLFALLGVLVLLPLFWFILQPYQRQRLTTFLDPDEDPLGAGYNSIQSMIAVGSGRLFGRGLGEGVQTQLAFLPEKQTDFIFAAVSEELGFLGSILTIIGFFVLLWVLIYVVGNSRDPAARAYVTGVFTVMLCQILVHIGMNMGLLPITGIPLPFVSAGGSSLIGTTISFALVVKSKKQ